MEVDSENDTATTQKTVNSVTRYTEFMNEHKYDAHQWTEHISTMEQVKEHELEMNRLEIECEIDECLRPLNYTPSITLPDFIVMLTINKNKSINVWHLNLVQMSMNYFTFYTFGNMTFEQNVMNLNEQYQHLCYGRHDIKIELQKVLGDENTVYIFDENNKEVSLHGSFDYNEYCCEQCIIFHQMEYCTNKIVQTHFAIGSDIGGNFYYSKHEWNRLRILLKTKLYQFDQQYNKMEQIVDCIVCYVFCGFGN